MKQIYPNSCREWGTAPGIGWQWISQEGWKVRIKTSTHWLVEDVSLQGNPSPERGFSVCRKKRWSNGHSCVAYTVLGLYFPCSCLYFSLISYSVLSSPPEEGAWHSVMGISLAALRHCVNFTLPRPVMQWRVGIPHSALLALFFLQSFVSWGSISHERLTAWCNLC